MSHNTVCSFVLPTLVVDSCMYIRYLLRRRPSSQKMTLRMQQVVDMQAYICMPSLPPSVHYNMNKSLAIVHRQQASYTQLREG